MGKRFRAKKETDRANPVPVVHRAEINRPLLAVGVIGILLTSYLAWTAFAGANVKGCSVGGGCDVVLSSRWATLLGLPTSFWGLLTYLTLAATAFMPRAESRWRLGWLVAMFGWVYSVYLTTVSLTILKAACPYCLTSLTLMTASFALVSYQRPTTIQNFSWGRWLKFSLPPAVAVILVLHLNYIGMFGQVPAEEDPQARALASYLSEQGAKFYGAYWCPHCQQQKEIFGLSAKRLPYVECSPDGQRSPQAPECVAQKIMNYPTWIINGQRIEEVLSLQRLADATGFHLPNAN
jgi:uncharacterized membrane protein